MSNIDDGSSVSNTQKINASLLEAYRSILTFHFGNVSLDMIEKLATSPLEAFSLEDIEHISDELSLVSYVKPCTLKEIEPYMLPCIAYNTKGEALVIVQVEQDRVQIKKKFYNDIETVSFSEIEDVFDTFIFFHKQQIKSDNLEIGDQKNKNWFYAPIKSSWRAYVEIGILTLFINIFGLALPLFTMSVYNRVVPNFATDTLFVLGFGVAVVLIFDVILKSARVYILENVVKKISNQLEEELFKKTLTLQSQYDHFLVGTKATLFRELHVVKDFFATKMIHLLDVPFFLTAMIVIYMIDPIIMIVPLSFAIFILGFNMLMQYPMSTWHKKSFEEGQTKQGYLIEQLQGLEAIKLANALPGRLYKWRKIINFHNYVQSKLQFLNTMSTFISAAALQLVSLLTIVVGVYSIHAGNLNVGGLIAVTILASRGMVPIINLSNVLIKYKQVQEALESLNTYWHLPTENQKYHELGLGKVKGEIIFDNVSFSYAKSEIPSVQNISFTIKPGEKVGIIGQTGAGKSTIQKLLCGIETPSAGKIFLDDADIATVHPVELRQNIALMPQEPYLFSGSLKDNLELSQTISKEQMTDVLRKTGLSELVRKSGSADTLNVGERGANLSVGQRHLVALARAMLSDAPIMILDEPTTGLDVGLEKKLVKHLDSALADKTLIVITHRFAALDLVNRVILVNDGKIIADGNKEEVFQMLQAQKEAA